MENVKKYIWSAYILIWVYFIFFDSSYDQDSHIFTYLFIGWVPFLILHSIWGKRNSSVNTFFHSRISNTQQLSFNLSGAILSTEQILSLAGITKTQYEEEYDKWPVDRKKKWENFLKFKNIKLDYSELNFTLTYLSHEDVFLIEAFTDSKRFTYVAINRSPNNTYLFDKTLVHYPNKNSGLTDEHIRLEVKLRKSDSYNLISVGLREFEKKSLGGSKYTNLFDFPFGSDGSDEEYKKFGFEIKRQSPWYDKDDFGNYTAHPWDTEIEYKHKSGAEITQNL